MKLIIQNNQIAGTATDDYTGPDEFITAPEGFDIERMGDFVVTDGVLSQRVPQIVSRAQFILALLQLDLLDDVETAIAAADRATQINYKERLEFDRNFPLIATMGAVLGKTDAEIDALFVLAATL